MVVIAEVLKVVIAEALKHRRARGWLGVQLELITALKEMLLGGCRHEGMNQENNSTSGPAMPSKRRDVGDCRKIVSDHRTVIRILVGLGC
jgi:hypothetical protein